MSMKLGVGWRGGVCHWMDRGGVIGKKRQTLMNVHGMCFYAPCIAAEVHLLFHLVTIYFTLNFCSCDHSNPHSSLHTGLNKKPECSALSFSQSLRLARLLFFFLNQIQSTLLKP